MRFITYLLAATLLILSFALPAAADDKDLPEDLNQTRALFSSINLLNGLHLNGEQLQSLLEINKEAELLRLQYVSASSEIIQEAQNHFQTLLEYYSLDARPSEEFESQAASHYHRLAEAEIEYRKKLFELGKRLDNFLTEGQHQIISEFKPCFIPPRSLREPARAGQADSSDIGVEILKRYRTIMEKAKEIEATNPRAGYSYGRSSAKSRNRDICVSLTARAKWAFSRRNLPSLLAKFERIKGKMTDKEKLRERKRVLSILDQGAALNDEQYAIESEKLAKSIFAPYEKYEKNYREAVELIARRRGQFSRAAYFLIKPELIPILEARLEQFAAY